MKFGLMKYDFTTNLGNEIQSIAAKRFLPKIDYYIDHEKLNKFNETKNVKLILNGWYLDCLKSWPPSEYIEPLLISMHFNTSVNETKEVILSEKSKNFFERYGPVGCRDKHTLEMLKENGIDSYYSGCLTLTLENNQKDKDFNEKYIVVNSNHSNEIISFIKTKTDLKIYNVQQESCYSFDRKYLNPIPNTYSLTSCFNYKEKFFMAENLLKLYENAFCVITDRMHCAYPCLAFKTPVLFLKEATFGLERLEDIHNFVLETDLENYKENYNIFDVENPPENSREYLKIRKELIKTTQKFTGHLNDTCYSNFSEEEIIKNNVFLLSKVGSESRSYIYNILYKNKNFKNKEQQFLDSKKEYEKIISEKNTEIKHYKNSLYKQKKLIKDLKNSKSWRITKPLRKISNNFKTNK